MGIFIPVQTDHLDLAYTVHALASRECTTLSATLTIGWGSVGQLATYAIGVYETGSAARPGR